MLRQIPGLHLLLVDHYQMEDAGFAERCEARARKRVEGYNVQWLKMPSEYAAHEIPDGSLDFVHLDGDASYDGAMLDIILWEKKVRKAG